MKTICRFWFAAVLTLGALGQWAALAYAQDSVHGKFSLPYTVNWENTLVPAGEYQYYLRPAGGSDLLTIEKIGGNISSGFLVQVYPPETGDSADVNRLVFGMKEGQRYVRSMRLPEFGLTMEFTLPDKLAHPGKQLARAETEPAPMPER
jgi:hypothetical protein